MTDPIAPVQLDTHLPEGDLSSLLSLQMHFEKIERMSTAGSACRCETSEVPTTDSILRRHLKGKGKGLNERRAIERTNNQNRECGANYYEFPTFTTNTGDYRLQRKVKMGGGIFLDPTHYWKV